MSRVFRNLWLAAFVVFATSATSFGSIVSTAAAANASHPQERYVNSRFEYSISYPSDLLSPDGDPPVNGDGRRFVSKDGQAKLLLYGSNNVLPQTLREHLKESISPDPDKKNVPVKVTYQVVKKSYYIVSGTVGTTVFYQKTFLKNDVFKTFRLEYNSSVKDIFDPIISELVKSFRDQI